MLVLQVPQRAGSQVYPVHVRIGGGTALQEMELADLVLASAEAFAEETGEVFLGGWVDAIGKSKDVVWKGIRNGFAGVKKYVCGVDYYHELRNMLNAATHDA